MTRGICPTGNGRHSAYGGVFDTRLMCHGGLSDRYSAPAALRSGGCVAGLTVAAQAVWAGFVATKAVCIFADLALDADLQLQMIERIIL